MSLYELRQIVKRYGAREVLQIKRLNILAGCCWVLLGPSGAGKSTLLRLLNFLEPPDSGMIYFDGEALPPSGPPLPWRRAITTVFQRPLLLRGSVWDNVAYALWLRGRYDPLRVEAALARVGLSDLAQAPASTLSGGEAQRVALARALVIEPRVLLLDEPTANLDPANVARIEEVIQGLRHGATTIILVTHNLFQARRLADEVALLIHGELVEAGPAASLFERPQDPRTVAFLTGKMVW